MKPIALALLLLAGCAASKPADPPAAQPAQIANPASEYCVKLGGKLEIRTEADGQRGYCHLPDGRVVDEWTLFRDSKAATSK